MNRGFSLLELAIVVTVSGLMVGFLLQANKANTTSECYAATRQQLATAKTAVESFARKNDRLPMPAQRNLGVNDPNYGREASAANVTQNNGISFGAFPFQAVGLPTSYAGDCWGNKLTYDVTTALTTSSSTGGYQDAAVNGVIQIVTAYNSGVPSIFDNTAAYAIISYGRDELGAAKINATSASWCASLTQSLRTANCSANSTNIANAAYNDGANAGMAYFDDAVVSADKIATSSSNLYCWGTDGGGTGVMADGSTVGNHQHLTPSMARTPLNFAKLSEQITYASTTSPCALTSDGTAYCWGQNESGQLGDGTTTNRAIPTKVNTTLTFNKVFTSVDQNGTNACGLTNDGTAYCWGSNQYGTIGTGTKFLDDGINRYTPTAVNTSVKFSTLLLRGHWVGALATDGQVYAWGEASHDLFGTPYNSYAPVLISAGHAFSKLVTTQWGLCAITSAADAGGAGKIFCAGDNTYNDLGRDYVSNISDITNANPPVVTTATAHGLHNGDRVLITHVAGMNEINNLQAYQDDGNAVYTVANATATTFELAGRNSTGYGTYTSGGIIETVNLTSFSEVAGGITFSQLGDPVNAVSYGLTAAGKMYTWGDAYSLRIGDNGADGVGSGYAPFFDVQSITQADPAVVTTTNPHGYATGDYVWLEYDNDSSGTMSEVGFKYFKIIVTSSTQFQLQTPQGVNINSTSYHAFTPGDGYVQKRPLSCSYRSVVDLVLCRSAPTLVSSSQNFMAGAMGINGVALSTAGDGYAWGPNWVGVGDGTGDGAGAPVAISSPSGLTYTRLLGLKDLMCAITATNDTYCWGGNSNGNAGLGNTNTLLVPTLIGGGHKFSSLLDVSSNYSAAVCGLVAP